MDHLSNPNISDAAAIAPFSIEQLQQDICTVMLLELRRVGQLFSDDVQWTPLGLPSGAQSGGWGDPTRDAAACGLTFEKAAQTELARAMLDHYDHGFLAISGTRSEPMFWDSLHTYLAAHVLDLSKSFYVEEWLGEGVPDLEDAIKRCLHTVQISNARRILEGHEPFCNKFGSGNEEGSFAGELSIPQLAMLAGMEEVSLRSAISRKTAPVLRISKDERRTYIEIEVAREWLKAKKRYIPVRSGRRSELNLSDTTFRNVAELARALDDHYGRVCRADPEVVDAADKLLAARSLACIGELEVTHFKDQGFMTELASVLKLEPQVLVFRAMEAALTTDLEATQNRLRALRAEAP